MNDLIITTNSFTPAKVEFNYQQIADQLEIVLAKYKGLVFTEETAADCKKTITELRKGKKSVEDFRKETKAKLSESIVEFENECKNLSLKFDNAILPLTEQADFFETNRKEEKRVKVQEIIDKLIIEYELDEKRSKDLILSDGYLITSISLKKVKETLTEGAVLLKSAQDQEKMNEDLIISIIEKVNKKDQVNMLADPYVGLLQHHNTNNVVARIYEDVEKIKEAREREKQRIIEEEQRLEQQKLFEQQKQDQVIERLDIAFGTVEPQPLVKVTDIENVDEYLHEKKIQQTEIEEVREYRIKATKEELDQLENFLNGNFQEWENITLGF